MEDSELEPLEFDELDLAEQAAFLAGMASGATGETIIAPDLSLRPIKLPNQMESSETN